MATSVTSSPGSTATATAVGSAAVNCATTGSLLMQLIAAYASSEKIKIYDMGETSRLVDQLMLGGHGSLQMIMDFDFTLTRHHRNGERCHTSHGILDNSPLMPDSYREAGLAGVKKYVPIEHDPNMPIAEKIPHMIEWYTLTHENLAKTRITRGQLEEIVKTNKHVYLRDNAEEMLEILHEAKIPTLIFSAGIGNLIQGVLQLYDIHYPNIHVISNFMKFETNPDKSDADQIIEGFVDPIVHIFNKNEETIPEDSTYFQDLGHRSNAIVLGDALTDVSMSSGLHNPNAVLKIGFLNDRLERLDEFMKTFDIVLIDDQSMDFVNILLKTILKK